jgi:hypothetical protein
MIAAPTLFFDLPMAYPMTAMTPIQTMIASIVSIQDGGIRFFRLDSSVAGSFSPVTFFGLGTLDLIDSFAAAI